LRAANPSHRPATQKNFTGPALSQDASARISSEPMSVTQTKSGAAPALKCWSCHASTTGGHFCSECGKIQPLPAGADYFAFFEWPRRLSLDDVALEAQFHKLSWKLHPDNFVRASEFEKNLSLERSSQLNDAYRTLRDPVSRVEYLLELHGVRKEGATKQQAPPELLEEVFELNESLDELREARAEGGDTASLRERLAAAQKNFQDKLAEVDGELSAAGREWDATLGPSDEAKRKAVLAMLNELLNRRSYIRNLVAGVQKELTGE
jgi:molecular chaperone HscB